jgi:CxxC motif-containing protein (DUF1111 family)
MRHASLSLAAASIAASSSLLAQSPSPTVADATNNAFSYPSPLLSAEDRRAFVVGNSFFKANWVERGASAKGLDGLGPLFNARSCSSCHLRDGRSSPPAPQDRERHGLLLRIGVRNGDAPDEAHPRYGAQVQDVAIAGAQPEAVVRIDYETVAGEYGDGTSYELLRPTYRLDALAYGELGEGAVLGPRVAQHLIGLGLLESLPESRLHELADPDDRDGDGVSGRVHVVRSASCGTEAAGRFGWKATQPTVLDQVAAAFVNDIGITSDVFADEALAGGQAAIQEAGGGPEIDRKKLDRVSFYTRTLAVPAARGVGDPQVRAGAQWFREFGCAACHVPSHTTSPNAFLPSYSNVSFEPYTDLLLHDMGEALVDGKRDGDARPAEWRTPPLWGLGLVEAVNGHERLLHDGRARGFAEAILWHGGEGERSKERFRLAGKSQREELVAFLRSL